MHDTSGAKEVGTSGPLMRKKKEPLSDASAWPIIVLPHPGGPYSSTPRGGFTPT